VWVEYGQHTDQIRNRQEWSLPQEDVLPRFQIRVVGHGAPVFHCKSPRLVQETSPPGFRKCWAWPSAFTY
jgi:hypothetical protein